MLFRSVELPAAPPIDYPPRLCLEVGARVNAEAYPRLADDIRSSIRRHCNFTAAVELVAQGSIASEHKTRRLYRSYLGTEAPTLEILYRAN